jgi:hypothetical protein
LILNSQKLRSLQAARNPIASVTVAVPSRLRLRKPDLKGTEAQLGQICRQDDDSESVAEAKRSAPGV